MEFPNNFETAAGRRRAKGLEIMRRGKFQMRINCRYLTQANLTSSPGAAKKDIGNCKPCSSAFLLRDEKLGEPFPFFRAEFAAIEHE